METWLFALGMDLMYATAGCSLQRADRSQSSVASWENCIHEHIFSDCTSDLRSIVTDLFLEAFLDIPFLTEKK